MRPRQHSAHYVRLTVCVVAALMPVAACAGRIAPRSTVPSPSLVNISELWVDPGDIQSRDLFHGPGGATSAPREAATYDLVAEDTSGFSPGYDVRDSDGTLWSVKVGVEAQSEVVASRILWAIGYHQPATYVVKSWTLSSKAPVKAGVVRFRREQPTHKVVDQWSWYENPFVTAQPFRGLIVANLILNNWDWKTSNNRVYEVANDPRVRRTYVVRDLGASFGKTSFPAILRWTPFRLMAQGSRNDLDDFEEQHFIKARTGDDIEFDYRGVHTRLVDTVSVTDVAWTCTLLARISERQWQDAFRAAGYDPAASERFIAKLKAKIQQGLAATANPTFQAVTTRGWRNPAAASTSMAMKVAPFPSAARITPR
jgi:hypothetical protein